MLRTETREIDGLRVTCTQYPALEQLEHLEVVSRVVGPLLLADLDPDSTNTALFFGAMPKGELPRLARVLLRCTSVVVDGRSIELTSDQAINQVFPGRLGTLVKVVIFAAGLNYGPFFASAPKVSGGAPSGAEPATSP